MRDKEVFLTYYHFLQVSFAKEKSEVSIELCEENKRQQISRELIHQDGNSFKISIFVMILKVELAHFS